MGISQQFPNLVVVPAPDGKTARLEETMLTQSGPWAPLVPRRQDFGSRFVSEGFAFAELKELPTRELQESYAACEASAKKDRRGIWRGPQERLIAAAEWGDVGAMQRAVDTGADVNQMGAGIYSGRTPLDAAAERGKIAHVRWLLDHGADIDGRDADAPTPLRRAWAKGQAEVVALLLHRGATLGAGKESSDLLVFAAYLAPEAPALDIIQWLLDHGTPVDGTDPASGTPLMAACAQNPPSVLELLIAHGANVNARAADGTRPIDVARRTHRPEIVELLRRHGATG